MNKYFLVIFPLNLALFKYRKIEQKYGIWTDSKINKT